MSKLRRTQEALVLSIITLIIAGLTLLSGVRLVSATAYFDLNTIVLSGTTSPVVEFETGEFIGTGGPIATESDLEAYAQELKLSDSALQDIVFTDETVEVLYRQRGRLLALVPVTFTVKAIAYADGGFELVYPWYSTLTIANKEEVETRVRVAIDTALRANSVGSVQSEGEVDNPRFTPLESAIVASEIRSVLRSSFDTWGQAGDE